MIAPHVIGGADEETASPENKKKRRACQPHRKSQITRKRVPLNTAFGKHPQSHGKSRWMVWNCSTSFGIRSRGI